MRYVLSLALLTACQAPFEPTRADAAIDNVDAACDPPLRPVGEPTFACHWEDSEFLQPSCDARWYPLAIHFQNDSAAPLYVWRECTWPARLYSCSGGDCSEEFVWDQPCGDCWCETCPSCDVCGGCLSQLFEVPPGQWFGICWSGTRFLRRAEAGCPSGTCWYGSEAAAGPYRVTLPVHRTEAEAIEHAPPYVVIHEFNYPVEDGLVEVSLAQ